MPNDDQFDHGAASGSDRDRSDYGDVLTTHEAARFLQTSEIVVQREAKFGRIPARKLSNQWRFSKVALLEWLKGEEKMLAPGSLFTL